MYKSDLLNTLKTRGYTYQCTDFELLDNILTSEKGIAFYIGFDCTADSLHVGSLIQIMLIRILQQHGNKPIILLGSGTTKIGDPSGKDEARLMISTEQILKNKEGLKKVFENYVSFSGSNAAIIVDNDEWLSDINYLEFLRDYGKHFSVNRMLSFDSVKLRLDRNQPLSFLEFNYMLLQSYDFLELYKRYGCVLQCGGSDQWGNIVNGMELIRRVKGKEVFGLTTPLMTTSSGTKMGKTASGAIWLNSDKLPSYDYWQFWRNTEDADVIKFLKLFTELSLNEIEELSKLEGQKINEAKIILANEVTKLCHGEKSAQEAEETAAKTFSTGAIGDNLPELKVTKKQVEDGIPIFKLLVDIGFCKSGGEARRLIKGGGTKLNDKKISSEVHNLSLEDFDQEKAKISAGKKKHGVVKIYAFN